MTHLPDSDLRELEGLLAPLQRSLPLALGKGEEDGPHNRFVDIEDEAERSVFFKYGAGTAEAADRDEEWARLIVAAVNALPSLIADLRETRERLDRAYIKIVDTCGFLRGNGDVAEVAARSLIDVVPIDFDGDEEEARARIKELEGKT